MCLQYVDLQATKSYKCIKSFIEKYVKIIVQILTAACMTIASLWKTNIVPNVSEVIKKVQMSSQYEQLLAYSTDSVQRFNNNWCWSCLFPIRDTKSDMNWSPGTTSH